MTHQTITRSRIELFKSCEKAALSYIVIKSVVPPDGCLQCPEKNFRLVMVQNIKEGQQVKMVEAILKSRDNKMKEKLILVIQEGKSQLPQQTPFHPQNKHSYFLFWPFPCFFVLCLLATDPRIFSACYF